jgi:HD-GYP domain-containing protein (c-di-GMP phosphodiesterase class II)
VAGKVVVTLQDASPSEQKQFLQLLKEAGFSIEPSSPSSAGETDYRHLQAMWRVLTQADSSWEDLAAVVEGVSGAIGLPVALFLPVQEKALLACRAASSGTPPSWIEAEFPAGSAEIALETKGKCRPFLFPLDKNDLSAGLLAALGDSAAEEKILSLLDGLAEAIGASRARTERLRSLDRGASLLDSSVDAMVEACTNLLELRGHETSGHRERVTVLSVRLGERLGLSGQELINLRRGALLHDIGKLTLPDSLLQKSPPLTEEDWKVLRTHTVRAYEAFRSVPALKGALDVPLRHHERFDGSGYPDGLKGKEIPLAARIFAVVDVWDALLSETCFRKRWSPEKVLDHLRRASGVQFDPDVVSAFASLLEEDPSLSERPF